MESKFKKGDLVIVTQECIDAEEKKFFSATKPEYFKMNTIYVVEETWIYSNIKEGKKFHVLVAGSNRFIHEKHFTHAHTMINS